MIETNADFIATVPSLLVLIQDETCRHLFSLLDSERLSLLAASCRLCFLLFESARSRLKFQLESYLLKLIDTVVSESPKIAFERRLIALESIAQLFRIPGTWTSITMDTYFYVLSVFIYNPLNLFFYDLFISYRVNLFIYI